MTSVFAAAGTSRVARTASKSSASCSSIAVDSSTTNRLMRDDETACPVNLVSSFAASSPGTFA